jgi:hypothetical protein
MRQREPHTPDAIPAVPGVLSADDVLATARTIAAAQEASGAICWPDGHVDVWDHIECAMALSAAGLTGPARRAYKWLRRSQRADGSWPRKIVAGRCSDPAAESNHAAYVAVGVWHEFQVTGDRGFAASMWPTVRRAVEWVLGMQAPGGEIAWERDSRGVPAGFALLSGCSSIHQSLRCGAALAEQVGDAQPDWELAADQLAHAIACHPESFADKSRFSMDWYYPVLGGAVRGAAAAARIAADWETFVVPGLGVRCVSDQPWVTGAESSELVLALDAAGQHAAAATLFADIQHLRDRDGAYWTGWQFTNRAHFPREQSAWTAAAVILAADALSGTTGGAGVFREPCAAGEAGGAPAADPSVCGCASGSAGGRAGALEHP